MNSLPDPVWPVVLLALIQIVDGAMCIKPVAFIAKCFDAVHLPRTYRKMLPPIKFAAAAGLIAGIWIPYLGAVTSCALVLYFVLAIAAHVRAQDFSRNLFVNAAGMFVICVATGVYSFVICR
ncbi:DoxX family protein [Occultella gossypii]|uniref:DoxX family protein n=1 Tax=Occultella gossypii TaxID=2800820 RepID=A0ABS7SFY2_9MICO|nr:DoxX family protein [Occultella gossypii]MBZ2199055.1 DoxX family protein [Occultella gossypii]